MSRFRKYRRHPLAQLVVWLALCVVTLLMTLVIVLANSPSSSQLDNTHMAGMKVGYGLCLEDQEATQQRRIVKPVLIGGSL